MAAKKTEKKQDTSIQAFEKFQALAAGALDDPESEEARSKAVMAIQMLDGESPDLVVLPRAEVEMLKKGIDGAREMQKASKDEKTKNLLVGALVGFGLAKGRLLG